MGDRGTCERPLRECLPRRLLLPAIGALRLLLKCKAPQSAKEQVLHGNALSLALADRTARPASGWVRRRHGREPATAGPPFTPARERVRCEPGVSGRADLRCHAVAALRHCARKHSEHRRGSLVIYDARRDAPLAAARAALKQATASRPGWPGQDGLCGLPGSLCAAWTALMRRLGGFPKL
jgi:hypothetical protein